MTERQDTQDKQAMPRDLLDRHRMLRLLIGMLVFVVGIFIASLVWSALVMLGDVILLFFLAWIIAFVLEPVSLLLQKRGMRRVFAVSLIYVALLVVISGVIVLTIPSIGSEVKLLGAEITQAFSPGNLSQLNASIISTLRHLGFSDKNAHAIVNSITDQIPKLTANYTSDVVNKTTQLLSSILTLLFDTFLVLIISFYMMLDGDRLVESFVRRLPPTWVPDVRLFQGYVEQIFGGFFRAQLAIGALYGIFTWLTLLIFQQDNGLLVGLISGIIMLLPLIGPPLSMIPPLLLVLLQSSPDDLGRNLILLTIVLILAQQLVMQLIAPRIYHVQMGIPPLILFAALLIGAKVSGVWGAFFAAPIVAVAYAMMRVYYDRFAERSTLFQRQPDTPDIVAVSEAGAAEPSKVKAETTEQRLRVTVEEGAGVASAPSIEEVKRSPTPAQSSPR